MNLELHSEGVERDRVLATATHKLVGTVAVALFLGGNPGTGLYFLIGAASRTIAVLRVEDIPTGV